MLYFYLFIQFCGQDEAHSEENELENESNVGDETNMENADDNKTDGEFKEDDRKDPESTEDSNCVQDENNEDSQSLNAEKKSNQNNIQATPEIENKNGSQDKVQQLEGSSKDAQDEITDAQDTGIL